jgi:hypothetical protein
VRVNKAIIDEGNDVALEKYESAIKEWRVAKGLFSLLAYDPFQYSYSAKRNLNLTVHSHWDLL